MGFRAYTDGMETSYCELHRKEAVNLTDGKRLGRVSDVVFTYPEGRVQGIVVPGGRGFRWGRAEIFIDLKCIKKIGVDVIAEEPPGKGQNANAGRSLTYVRDDGLGSGGMTGWGRRVRSRHGTSPRWARIVLCATIPPLSPLCTRGAWLHPRHSEMRRSRLRNPLAFVSLCGGVGIPHIRSG